MIYKNVAGQKCLIFAWDAAAGAAKTGDAANITAYISKDGGAAAQSNDANPTELDATKLPGVYAFDLTQAETNCDLFLLAAKSATSDVQIEPVIAYTTAVTTMRAALLDYLDAAMTSRAEPGDAMALTAAERAALNTLFGASSQTLSQAVKLLLAAMLGKTSGFVAGEASSPVFRDIEDSEDVIEAEVDEDGNRTEVTIA